MRYRYLSAALLVATAVVAVASDDHGKAVERHHVTAPHAPLMQTAAQATAKSAGCMDCHERSDQPTMHASPAVVLGCTDCHGGDAAVRWQGDAVATSPEYAATRDRAHVLPRFPEDWRYPASANPERSYTLLNREAPEFIRFVNPSDYRVVREACGACHLKTILAAERSLMSTIAMFWGGAAYNNGLLPFKNYILGEAYTREGEAAILEGAPASAEDRAAHGIIERLYPLPRWQTLKPADICRVFEDGGRNLSNLFPETGLPNAAGQIQRLEEPGRPDIRQSNRGPGTGARIAVPVLNIHKTLVASLACSAGVYLLITSTTAIRSVAAAKALRTIGLSKGGLTVLKPKMETPGLALFSVGSQGMPDFIDVIGIVWAPGSGVGNGIIVAAAETGGGFSCSAGSPAGVETNSLRSHATPPMMGFLWSQLL